MTEYKTIGRAGRWSGAWKEHASVLIERGRPHTCLSYAEFDELVVGGTVIPAELWGQQVEVDDLITGTVAGVRLRKGDVHFIDAEVYIDLVIRGFVRATNPTIWSPSLPEPDPATVKRIFNNAVNEAVQAQGPKPNFVQRYLQRRNGQ